MTLVFVLVACVYGVMPVASADVSKMYLIRDFWMKTICFYQYFIPW